MLSNNQIKYITSLRKKKNIYLYREFIAEGNKIVNEIIEHNKHSINNKFRIKKIYAESEWINNMYSDISGYKDIIQKLLPGELKKISALYTPNSVLAIISMPDIKFNYHDINSKLSIYLNDIQDPGNFGNIIRISDWFGINNVFCSKNCVDLYNYKVIQSSMGSFCRVNVFYIDINILVKNMDNSAPVYGTFLDGENIYSLKLQQKGLIILGNESKGVDKNLGKIVTKKIKIPGFPPDNNITDSLNVSAAAGIICSEFRRRMY